MNRPAETREDGFTLIETLVAFLILSMALGVALQSLSQSTMHTDRSRVQSELRVASKSLLAEILPSISSPTRQSGRWDDRFDWTLVVERHDLAGTSGLHSLVLTVRETGHMRLAATYVDFIEIHGR